MADLFFFWKLSICGTKRIVLVNHSFSHIALLRTLFLTLFDLVFYNILFYSLIQYQYHLLQQFVFKVCYLFFYICFLLSWITYNNVLVSHIFNMMRMYPFGCVILWTTLYKKLEVCKYNLKG